MSPRNVEVVPLDVWCCLMVAKEAIQKEATRSWVNGGLTTPLRYRVAWLGLGLAPWIGPPATGVGSVETKSPTGVVVPWGWLGLALTYAATTWTGSLTIAGSVMIGSPSASKVMAAPSATM